ncbi:MAG: OmpH family outer membrane protein [Candidatus Lokiarchaeota archaeon]|nr:OmpH family outer membrane protein [Candidatus Harpocratesius repetitus]
MAEFDIKHLIKILPKLIRENDEIKGAIITALSGVVATREDIKELIKEMDKRFEAMQKQMDKRFEAMDKRFEAMDKRFEAMQKQMDKKFDVIDKRFEAMQKQMDKKFDVIDKRFEAMQKQMDKKFDVIDKRFEAVQKQMNDRFTDVNNNFTLVFRRLDEISIGADVSFELFCKNVIKSLLKAENIDIPFIESGRHFSDPKHQVFKDTTDVEIDLFCPEPPIIGEVTYKIFDPSKMKKFIRKIEFMENEIFKKSARRYFCALEISKECYSEIYTIAQKHQIKIISKEIKI